MISQAVTNLHTCPILSSRKYNQVYFSIQLICYIEKIFLAFFIIYIGGTFEFHNFIFTKANQREWDFEDRLKMNKPLSMKPGHAIQLIANDAIQKAHFVIRFFLQISKGELLLLQFAKNQAIGGEVRAQ